MLLSCTCSEISFLLEDTFFISLWLIYRYPVTDESTEEVFKCRHWTDQWCSLIRHIDVFKCCCFVVPPFSNQDSFGHIDCPKLVINSILFYSRLVCFILFHSILSLNTPKAITMIWGSLFHLLSPADCRKTNYTFVPSSWSEVYGEKFKNVKTSTHINIRPRFNVPIMKSTPIDMNTKISVNTHAKHEKCMLMAIAENCRFIPCRKCRWTTHRSIWLHKSQIHRCSFCKNRLFIIKNKKNGILFCGIRLQTTVIVIKIRT